MKSVVVFVALFGICYGASGECWSIQEIADEVFRLADVNPTDNVVTLDEFKNELLTDWGFANGCLAKHQFTSNWDLHFHDAPNNAHTMFDNLDTNGDGRLCELEVGFQIIIYDNVVNDGQIQPQEMLNFLMAKHPDPHRQHGCH